MRDKRNIELQRKKAHHDKILYNYITFYLNKNKTIYDLNIYSIF